jgi:hypothetical protein
MQRVHSPLFLAVPMYHTACGMALAFVWAASLGEVFQAGLLSLPAAG